MIRHILLFSLDPDASLAASRAMFSELEGFPARFEQILDWQMGRNASGRDDSFDYGVTMRFADRDALAAYLNSEEHEHFVRERFRPVISKRAIVSFDIDG